MQIYHTGWITPAVVVTVNEISNYKAISIHSLLSLGCWILKKIHAANRKVQQHCSVITAWFDGFKAKQHTCKNTLNIKARKSILNSTLLHQKGRKMKHICFHPMDNENMTRAILCFSTAIIQTFNITFSKWFAFCRSDYWPFTVWSWVSWFWMVKRV